MAGGGTHKFTYMWKLNKVFNYERLNSASRNNTSNANLLFAGVSM